MAISLRASAKSTAGNATCTKPTGVVSGDVMVAIVYINDKTSTVTAPNGWTLLDSIGGTNAWRLQSYVVVAGGSEPANYTWTNASGYTDALIVAYIGVDNVNPVDVHAGQQATATSVTAPSVTTTVANDMLIVGASTFSGVAFNTATGWTLLDEADGVAMFYDHSVSSSGATGTFSFTYSGGASSDTVGLTVALKPAGGGGGTAWNQNLTDTQSALDTRLSQPQKRPIEFQSALDALVKNYTSSQSEKFSSLDAALKAAQHLLTGDVTSATDSTQRARGAVKNLLDAFSELDTTTRRGGKGLFEGTSALDTQSNRAGRFTSDAFSSLESSVHAPSHFLSGDVTSATDAMQRARGSVWTIVDAFSSRDSITQHAISKLLGETLSSLDTTRFATTHQIVDTLVLIDVLSKLPSHLLAEIISSTDSFSGTKNAGAVAWLKTLTESQSAQDLRITAVSKPLSETQSAQDTRTALVIKALGENLTLVDSQSWQTVHRIVDNLSATDKFTAGRALLLALQDWFSSTDVSSEVKQQALAQGHLAVLSLTISNLLGVHLAISTSASVSAVINAITSALHATLARTNALQSQQTLSSSIRATLALR